MLQCSTNIVIKQGYQKSESREEIPHAFDPRHKLVPQQIILREKTLPGSDSLFAATQSKYDRSVCSNRLGLYKDVCNKGMSLYHSFTMF